MTVPVDPRDAARSGACPYCGGQRVAPPVYAGSVTLSIQRRTAWSTHIVTEVDALACTRCGLVTFHVTDLAALHTDIAEHPQTYGLSG